MAATDTNPTQLHMRRNLADLPALTIPTGYQLRTFHPGDEAAWVALLNQNGELGAWDLERVAPNFLPGSRTPLDGSFFLMKDGEPAATAQLILTRDGEYAPTPELGWVAASPGHRGHGLGYAICLAVMHYAADHDHLEIYLKTDDPRLPAIAVYLKLGFEPWMVDAEAPARWSAVRQALNGGRANDRGTAQ